MELAARETEILRIMNRALFYA